METKIHLPNSIKQVLAKKLNPHESILYTQKSDLSIEKKFDDTYLIISQQNIYVITDGKIINQLPIKKIVKLKIDELFNHARLQAVSHQKTEITILYFTKTHAPQFRHLIRLVNQYLQDGQYKPHTFTASMITHCPRCHNPLPERGGICPLCLPRWSIMARLLSFLKPYQKISFLVLLSTTVMVISQLIPPYITKRIVDDVLTNSQHDQFIFWISAMFISGLVYFISSYFSGIYSSWLATKLVNDFRNLLYQKILHLKLNYFDRHSSGDLVSKIVDDTSEIQHFLLDGLPFLLINFVSLIIIAIILISIDPTLSLLVFLPVPFLVFGSSWFLNKLIPLFHYRGSIKDLIYTNLDETIGGIRVVKAFTQQDRHINEFTNQNNRYFANQYHIEKTFIGFRQVMFFIMQVGIVGVWYFASRRIMGQDHLTLGDLLAFVGYIWLFYGPLQWFTQILNWMTHALASAERMFTILDMTSETSPAESPTSPHITQGKIEFKQVRFSYEYGREAIKDISFTINPGEMIGLVGKSGGGKSTIINLINNFFDIDSGLILIDGHNIKEYPLAYLRHRIGVVMQEPFLFDVSIAENIRYGHPEASFDQIVQAAKAAWAHEFIVNKEKGYNTIIGEKGVRLSGGEKQRLSIARAILQNPPILILDEATSSVDVQTEKKIQQALEKLTQNRTTIAIAHRLSTLRHADRILYIEGGKIIESGSHSSLLRKKGKYHQLVNLQTKLNQSRPEIIS
ncbi:MAG: ABC transporter ATP-binding protein [Patescibacteria group bacterium]